MMKRHLVDFAKGVFLLHYQHKKQKRKGHNLLSGYIIIDILIYLSLLCSAAFTLIGILIPLCKLIGVMYDDGYIVFYKFGFEIKLTRIIRVKKGKYQDRELKEKKKSDDVLVELPVLSIDDIIAEMN